MTDSVIDKLVEKLGPKEGNLRVWWIPQVPMKAFHVHVGSIDEAMLVLNVLAYYDLFQYENTVKGDYANAGGLNIFEDGEWIDWSTENGDGIDDLINQHYPNGGMVKS